MLAADESPRQMGRRIVIRLELLAKVGRHLLRAASTLKGLRAIWLGDDKGFPPAYEMLDQVKEQTGDIPLIVSEMGFDEFCQALEEHRLVGGVFYYVTDVPDVDSANRCMDRVREYRP